MPVTVVCCANAFVLQFICLTSCDAFGWILPSMPSDSLHSPNSLTSSKTRTFDAILIHSPRTWSIDSIHLHTSAYLWTGTRWETPSTLFGWVFHHMRLVGVVGELVAFVSFLSLSVSVFLEMLKHLVDVVFIIPTRENNSLTLLTPHGNGQFKHLNDRRRASSLEHIHSLIDNPKFILGVGIYATISNVLLGTAILCKQNSMSRTHVHRVIWI